MKKLVVLSIGFIISSMILYVGCKKSDVKNTNMSCPRCDSNEVLYLGIDLDGNQRCYCYECHCEFTIE